MKKVEAIIKPFRLDAVQSALARLGVQGLTISEVRGFGRSKGHIEHFRGSEYTIDLLPKLKIELVIDDSEVGEAIAAITSAARTGQIGDGKIYVSNLAAVVRIRTGEREHAAIV